MIPSDVIVAGVMWLILAVGTLAALNLAKFYFRKDRTR